MLFCVASSDVIKAFDNCNNVNNDASLQQIKEKCIHAIKVEQSCVKSKAL